jgi:hypothetical protein
MQQTNPYWLVSKAPRNLNKQLSIATSYGYAITSQTTTTAQLLRKKTFSCLIATLSFFVFGVGVLVYLFYFLAKRDELIYLDLTSQPTAAQVAVLRTRRIQLCVMAGAAVFALLTVFIALLIV